MVTCSAVTHPTMTSKQDNVVYEMNSKGTMTLKISVWLGVDMIIV